MKATAIIEDFTALGTISSVAALDVLHAMGITTAVLPAMVLSSSTEGFGVPERMRTDEWIDRAFYHWKGQGSLQLQNGLVGYLGTKTVIDEVAKIATQSNWKNFLVDPVMADDGSLYDGFTDDYPHAMIKLAKLATVMTPNWTELQLLTGTKDLSVNDNDQLIAQQIQKLRQQGVAADIVVTGIHRNGQLGAFTFSKEASDQPIYCGGKPYPGHFYGTGDTFSALLMGYLVAGKPLQTAVKAATNAIDIAVAETAELPVDERIYGMKTQRLMHHLTTEFKS